MDEMRTQITEIVILATDHPANKKKVFLKTLEISLKLKCLTGNLIKQDLL